MIPLWIIGSGGHAKVVIDAARAGGEFEPVGCLDDDPARHGAQVSGLVVVGAITRENVTHFHIGHAFIAIGSNATRKRIASKLGNLLRWGTIVHPHSWIASGAQLGEGTMVCAGAIVQSDACVGKHAILNTACSIDHETKVGDFAHIAPGAHLAGGVRVGDGAFIGHGAGVIPGTCVGEWSTVGAGSIVIRDVTPGCTVVGVPARRQVASKHTQATTEMPADFEPHSQADRHRLS